MKFLHTADWQIGMKAAHVAQAGPRVRRERLEAAKRVVEAANRHAVEFLLVAGDTFEDNAVERVLVQQTADILAAAAMPVYIIPGNHDPWTPGAVWDHEAWRAFDHLRVFRADEAIDVSGGRIYACPLLEKSSSRDPTAWIDATNDDGVAIGLAHGNVQGPQGDEIEYPIARDAATRCGLDFLALGHWHSTALYNDAAGAPRMAYSGAHEPTKFGERDSGAALLVEIDARGAAPRITPIATGGLTWLQWRETVDGDEDLAALARRVEAVDAPDATLLDLSIEGVLRAGSIEMLARIEELLAARFLYATCDASGLAPEPSDESWTASLPPGPLRTAAERLSERSAASRDDEARIATEALRMLYRMTTANTP